MQHCSFQKKITPSTRQRRALPDMSILGYAPPFLIILVFCLVSAAFISFAFLLVLLVLLVPFWRWSSYNPVSYTHL